MRGKAAGLTNTSSKVPLYAGDLSALYLWALTAADSSVTAKRLNDNKDIMRMTLIFLFIMVIISFMAEVGKDAKVKL